MANKIRFFFLALVLSSGLYQGYASSVVIEGASGACPGEIITLTAQILWTADSTTHYQWLMDGQYLPGANGQRYAFNSATLSGIHVFTVEISADGCNIVSSPDFYFTVNEQPHTILATINTCNSTVLLEASTYTTTGQQPYKWIWYLDNITPANVVATTYSNHYSATQEGLYYVQAVFQQGMCNSFSDSARAKINALPTAQFTRGDSSIVCANNSNNIRIPMEITFTGTAPFSFELENVTTGEIFHYISITSNPYTVFVTPSVTSVYRIHNLTDAFCSASEESQAETVVYISKIDVPTFFMTDCEEHNTQAYHTVQLPINIISGNPATYSTYLSDSIQYNIINGTVTNPYPQVTTIEIHLPLTPGDYEVEIEIEGCRYIATGRVMVRGNTLGGSAIIEQRWNDVLVVNNNPDNNGGFIFYAYQWYKNGVIIPNATQQYYHENNGLNGAYHVALEGYAKLANGDTVRVHFITCPVSPSADFGLKIYPVPARIHQAVTVEINLSEKELQGAVMYIYDAKGALIKQINSLHPVTTIDPPHAQGIYIGHVITDQNVSKNIKFIVVQ